MAELPFLPADESSSSSSSGLIDLDDEEAIGSVVIHEPVLDTDTLESLAAKYHTTVEAIMKKNNLSPTTALSSKLSLLIPVSSEVPPTPPTAESKPGPQLSDVIDFGNLEEEPKPPPKRPQSKKMELKFTPQVNDYGRGYQSGGDYQRSSYQDQPSTSYGGYEEATGKWKPRYMQGNEDYTPAPRKFYKHVNESSLFGNDPGEDFVIQREKKVKERLGHHLSGKTNGKFTAMSLPGVLEQAEDHFIHWLLLHKFTSKEAELTTGQILSCVVEGGSIEESLVVLRSDIPKQKKEKKHTKKETEITPLKEKEKEKELENTDPDFGTRLAFRVSFNIQCKSSCDFFCFFCAPASLVLTYSMSVWKTYEREDKKIRSNFPQTVDEINKKANAEEEANPIFSFASKFGGSSSSEKKKKKRHKSKSHHKKSRKEKGKKKGKGKGKDKGKEKEERGILETAGDHVQATLEVAADKLQSALNKVPVSSSSSESCSSETSSSSYDNDSD